MSSSSNYSGMMLTANYYDYDDDYGEEDEEHVDFSRLSNVFWLLLWLFQFAEDSFLSEVQGVPKFLSVTSVTLRSR